MDLPTPVSPPTKREILNEVARLFDPVDFVAPVGPRAETIHLLCASSLALTPIAPLRDDPNNKFPLSPADCLLGRTLYDVVEPTVPNFPGNRLDFVTSIRNSGGTGTTSIWRHYRSAINGEGNSPTYRWETSSQSRKTVYRPSIGGWAELSSYIRSHS